MWCFPLLHVNLHVKKGQHAGPFSLSCVFQLVTHNILCKTSTLFWIDEVEEPLEILLVSEVDLNLVLAFGGLDLDGSTQ